MNGKTASVSFRIDAKVKNQADILFAELGMNMTTAFNIFLRQSIREGAIPFHITTNTPNADTIAAMVEAEAIANDPGIYKYTDVESALRDLKK